MSDNAQQGLLAYLGVMLAPLRAVVESEFLLRDMAASVGWDLDEITGLPLGELQARLNEFASSFETLSGFIETPPQTFSELGAALDAADGAFQSIRDISTIMAEGAQPSQFKEFGRDLVSAMTIAHLQAQTPILYHLAVLLTVVELANNDALSEPVFDSAGNLVRVPHTRPKLHLGRIIDLIKSPDELLRDEYVGPGGLVTAEDAQRTADKLFPRLGALLAVLGANANYGVKPQYGVDLGDPDNLAAGVLTFWLELQAADAQVGATLSLSPAERGDLGLVVSPFGSIEFEELFGEWVLRVSLTAGVDAFALGPRGLRLLLGERGGGDRLVARLEVARMAESGETVTRIGSTTGTRLEAKRLRVLGEANLGPDEQEYGLLAEAEGAVFVLMPGDGDGFLQKILPEDGLRMNFDLAVGFSNIQWFYFRGSAGLEAQLPLHVSVGPVAVESVNLAIRAGNEGIRNELAATARFQLGPLTVVVKQVGLTATLHFPEGGGNLGEANLSLGFKPPSGLGLSVDGGGFKGGGFIEFEPDEERYSGMLELEFQDQFSLKAFALLNTRLPNGQSGFSLLIVISSEFTPIQLGFGFKLNGVGGLLGLNRTVKIEPLRAGLRDNTLGSILFPTDIVANADRILSDLRQVFPPQEGRFIFGPMAKITWGTPTLITIELGLVIEIPDPIRLVILGIVRAILPDEKASLLRLQVNFLGEINFERQQLSFDATLFDSKLLGFTLTGDMAIRLYWGAEANFLMTVGGFHPAYQPPPMNLPSIRRLTLALLSGDNPRLTLEMYFAVTSNTVQFGARLELYASAWKFNVYGLLSFDVLFQFNPFYFIADITAMLALRIGSSSIASIKLTLTLEGPTPWKAKGTASFKVCWFFTLKIRFNKTFGEARNTTLPDLAVLPLLLEALSAADNWEGELPERKHRLESFREVQALSPDRLLVHPVGTLKVSQKVVPLNIRIDRIGSQRPSDANEFHIHEVSISNPDPTQESFAPAQFFDMNDEEKLASPSFKNFDSGVRIGEPDHLHTAYAAVRDVTYELKYIDSQRHQRLVGPKGFFDVDAVTFNSWTLQGAIAKSELSFASTRKSSLAPEEVALAQEPFAVVNTGDLKLFDESSLLNSERAALTRINALIANNPALRGTLQAVPAFEMSA
ncbi:MAG: hypothetical protein M3410_10300 [Acidobacteriota bacterium]|nr:hypothetical protein [Acidobacteriota bacterium]